MTSFLSRIGLKFNDLTYVCDIADVGLRSRRLLDIPYNSNYF